MSWRVILDQCPDCDSQRTLQTSLPDTFTGTATIDCLECGTQFAATLRVSRLTSRRLNATDSLDRRDMTAPGAALITALMQRGTP